MYVRKGWMPSLFRKRPHVSTLWLHEGPVCRAETLLNVKARVKMSITCVETMSWQPTFEHERNSK